jgi:small-conductance mechanosensitive channel
MTGMAVVALCCIQQHNIDGQTSPPKEAPSRASQPTPQPSSAYDAAARSKAILAHLNAVLRFYRDAEAPIQKVGEPSDLVYRDRAVTEATQIAQFAFQSAKAEAALIERGTQQGQTITASGSQAQRLKDARNRAEQQISALKSQEATLTKKLETASQKQRASLQQQLDQVNGELELQSAMEDALGKIAGMAGTSSESGFAAQVDQLERSAPGVTANKAVAVAPTLESLSETRNTGVTSQARVLIDLLNTRESINNLIKESDRLHQRTLVLRTPLITLLRNTLAQGQVLAQNSAAGPSASVKNQSSQKDLGSANASTPASTKNDFKQLIATFKTLSSATVPLSQEILTLERSQANLQAWSNSVNVEYQSVLRSLFLRVLFIAIALAVIFAFGEVWRRATQRYVHDVRRRRQLLVVRRLVTGFLSGLVLIFGLVTQFSSLATFAGLITAGIAVGLQAILLSVAAYFFIVGRYGIKVGDRITIAGVTGDVIEVGLVRFYMMEMAGNGTDLYPSGRVAVFSNAVLFQAGTPLYKQMPGAEYAWHELTVKLSADADYRSATQEIIKSLQKVYDEYRPQIEQRHKHFESWMDSSLDLPTLQSNLQLVDNGLQLWVRYPVIIRQAAAIDEKITESFLQLISSNSAVKAAVSSQPAIKAAVKG